ncbi:MAG: flagellar capping protein [Pseudobutyrivibrio sp.]|nr:flagellar capping protein [Pseudobutyrivibrio sp.]
MARIDAAYNYFLSTYGDDIGKRYESHKKSELRDTYNKIVKANKDSPLYKIKDSEDMGQFAIDIKEHANAMTLAVSNLSDTGDISGIMEKRIAFSSDDNTIGVLFVGDENSPIDEFSVQVDAIATSQVNTGNFLYDQGHDFESGQYSFDLETRNHSYEFQYNVNFGETNSDVQNKIVRLINTSDVGLSAKLVTGPNSTSAVQVRSKNTGLGIGEEYIFKISSPSNFRELDTLGIGRMTEAPSNSSFRLNGNEHSSMSNTFTVNKSFELSLKAVSDEPVTIGIMNDTEALSQGVNQMLDSYNSMLDIGLRYNGTHQNRALFNDISSVSKGLSEELANVGISIDDKSHMSLDKDKLFEIINSGDRQAAFDVLNKLKDSISSAASRASINPMAYVDKTVVEYKNPNHTLAAPYASSQYAGMMVNYGL